MVKVAGGRFYFYYGIIPLLEKMQRYNDIILLYHKALKILTNKSIELVDIKGIIPFNVIAVDKKNSSVSFMWYYGFWELERPLLIYSIKINTINESISVYTRKYTKALGSWPWNYIHRKELFVDGLEKLAVDPYNSGLSLAWDTNAQKDVWVKLEWIPIIVSVKADSKDSITRLQTIIKNAINHVKNVKKRAKIIIEISP